MIDHSPPVEGWQAEPDGAVASVQSIPLLWRGGRRSLMERLRRFSQFPSCGGEMPSTDTLGCRCSSSALVNSPPAEGWQAQPDGVVASVQSIPLLWREAGEA